MLKWKETVDANAAALIAKMQKKLADRPAANWQSIADVDWDDLDFYIQKCKSDPDKDSFDTAMEVLKGLRYQILERK